MIAPKDFASVIASLRWLTCACQTMHPAAMSRSLYLAAYDIAEPKRLHRMLVAVKGYATGGQKSVFECWLDNGEKKQLLSASATIMSLNEDRFMLLRLDPRQKPRLLGLAQPPADPAFYYYG